MTLGLLGPGAVAGAAGEAGKVLKADDPLFKTEALGNVSGTVTCDLSKALTFTMTQTGNVTLKITNWPTGEAEPLFYITQDGTGGRKITVEGGVVWQNEEPTFSEAPNAVNQIPLSSPNGGLTVYGQRGQKGATGATGATGPTGPEGAKGAGQGAYSGLWVPAWAGNGIPRANAFSAVGTANKAYSALGLVEKTGKIKKIRVANGATINGNTRVAILDVGKATAGKYTVLGQVSAAQAGAEKFQGLELAEAISVTLGQWIVLGLMNSGTTATYGFGNSFVGEAERLLEGDVTGIAAGMGGPLFSGMKEYGAFEFTTLTAAEMALNVKPPVIYAVIE